jgi:hypothetical protein
VGDVDLTVPFVRLAQENLFLVPGSLTLSRYESMLSDSSFNDAASGNRRGYLDTSAIDRYLNFRGIEDGVDIFVIDSSPSLGALNRVLLLGADFFVVPMMADAFSVQGVENLGLQLERWKRNWLMTARALARDPKSGIDNSEVLQGECLFLGYIVNNFRDSCKMMKSEVHFEHCSEPYWGTVNEGRRNGRGVRILQESLNVYSGKTIQRQDEWRQKIPLKVKEFLSEKHCKNGLVNTSWPTPLGNIQDSGQLTAISMELCKAVQFLTPQDDPKLNLVGTRELAEKARVEFESLGDNLLGLVLRY